jgi:hypothetical protein
MHFKEEKKRRSGKWEKLCAGVSGSLIGSGRLHATVRDRERSPFHAVCAGTGSIAMRLDAMWIHTTGGTRVGGQAEQKERNLK